MRRADLACAIHVHSVFSDGSGTVRDPSGASRAARPVGAALALVGLGFSGWLT
jgi:hypothetical protein